MSNFLPTKNLYLDTITFMPTACDYPGTSKKCYYTAKLDTVLNCEEDDVTDAINLASIFKGKSSTA